MPFLSGYDFQRSGNQGGMGSVFGGGQPFKMFNPMSTNAGRPAALGNRQAGDMNSPLQGVMGSGPIFGQQQLQQAFPNLQGQPGAQVDPVTGANVPQYFRSNERTGIDVFRDVAFQEAGAQQQIANEKFNVLERITGKTADQLQMNIDAFNQIGEGAQATLTEQGNQDYLDIKHRVHQQEAGVQDYRAASVQARLEGSRAAIADELAEINSAEADGGFLDSAQRRARTERLKQRERMALGTEIAQTSQAYNALLTGTRVQGTSQLIDAQARKRNAVTVGANIALQARQAASQLSLQGHAMLANMVENNPRSLVSRLSVLSFLHNLSSAPGAEANASRAAGIPYRPKTYGLQPGGFRPNPLR